MYFELQFVSGESSTYGVKFSRVGNRTFAELMKVESNGKLSHTNIYGEVGLFYKDTFNAVTGRKLALGLLLDKMQKPFKLTKELRKQIWDIYFQTHKK